MNVRDTVIASTVAVLLFLSGRSLGATKDVVKRIEALNLEALGSYKAGDAEKAKTRLMEAVVLGKENDLDTHAVMAKTYLNLALIHSEGLADEEKGKRYLALAKRINPKIKVPPELSDGEAGKGVAAEALELKQKEEAATAVVEASQAKQKEKAATAEALEARQKEKAAAAEASDAKQKEKRALEEKDKVAKDLALFKDGEKRERDAKERLLKEKADADKQLAQLKESEKKEREAKEQLQRAKADTEKLLAQTKDSEKKEREARERLEKELAAAKERESKERTARETLEKEKQLAENREKERKSQAEQDRQARDKLVEGPDLPSQVPQTLYCPASDEWVQGVEVFVHCVPQQNVKAKTVAFYYRTSGSVHYNSLAMDRSKKGWFIAAVPANYVTGKVLQYYAEAIDSRGDVTATNGKATSPNIMTLRRPGSPVATTARPEDASSLVPARAVSGKSSSARPRAVRKDRHKSP